MMQGTGESNPLSSATADSPPSSIGLGMGMGMGMGIGAAMRAEKDKGRKPRKKLPTPKEMIAHYESKGMQSQEASLKVIDDLQNLLMRVVTTAKNTNTNLDPINSRLLRLESKLDSKPGYTQTLGIGIVSGAVIRVFPQVAASVVHIWNCVRESTSST
ncbi:uncharacterized protein LOC112509857 [Cynara cardunculus var. scolymus]|uniref:Uncharacterized protein n=1 Tax=Cynara cardunculus var. scolymus TaxID=59895 RepID=A0A103YB19_CYNCS|nr:uncharacterized protein LOC112509857 [Cynara cardunculus var. scolymus]KVI05800.1 hypothetical protein Ccrd_015862 [Cynara cardunculus var. scolymus]